MIKNCCHKRKRASARLVTPFFYLSDSFYLLSHRQTQFCPDFSHQSRNERVRNVDDVPLFVVGIQEAWLGNSLDVGMFQV